MHNRIKNHLTEWVGFGTSVIGVIAARQEQIAWWLQCLGSVVATLAGCFTLYSFIKNQRKNEKAIIAAALMNRLADKDLSPEQVKKTRALIKKALNNETIRPEDLV